MCQHKERDMKTKTKKYITGAVSAVILLCAGLAAEQYYRLSTNNIESKDGKEHLLYVYPNATLDSVLQTVEENYDIATVRVLKFHARLMHFQRPRTGCYRIPIREGNYTFLKRLRGGEQTPVELSFNNIRTREQLAHRLSQQLLTDSLSIITRLESDSFMSQYGLSKETAVSMFLPNTYEVFWTISADQLFARMYREYEHFWTSARLEAAKALGLSPAEVSIIASIIEEETNKKEEYPVIAGLYLNRLRSGMPLQACPTVKFALQDFTLRRILYEHLQYDSPYNTYKHKGLPPGPIRIPRASTLDAVLHAAKHNYLYMCASTEFDGTHPFSSTYAEHARYARTYQAILNQKGIGTKKQVSRKENRGRHAD